VDATHAHSFCCYSSVEQRALSDGSRSDPQLGLRPFEGDARVQLLQLEENAGPSGARMAGLAQVTGEYLGFLDSDDRYAPGALAEMRKRLDQNPAADIAMGRKVGLFEQSDKTFATDGDVVRMYSFGSIMIRRTLLDEIAIDTTIRHGEDIDWFFRAQEAGVQFELLDTVVQHYRRHASNLTQIEEGAAKRGELADVMARSMFRRRKLAKQRGVGFDQIYYVHPDKFDN